eukprot:CAMPEP_0184372074 /NCGR_PEP_ID=MMETSP1089-20130417/163749_1 /TAXON_ID=38269 ORGANISM="Gloeochaete wittrockiana, Strain SAG46.84" /NCGR_SAMPLE_ID=MMETSP1089 /ASSEMBLY_ACC=CAM_ASM_000445 /LENGTH=484 /DNA_ID=CAMNT_0026714893 /DNA_START=5 /DNA_END=1459 /DNA_ORIENTATION=-
MNTEQQLEANSGPWGEVEDHIEAKVVLSKAARVADVTIPLDAPFIHYPEEDNFAVHPLVAGFQDLKLKNRDVSHAPSRDGKFYKKHIHLFGDGLPRDKLFELRNLHLMKLDVRSFLIVKQSIEKILFQNAEQNDAEFGAALGALLTELSGTKERYLEYNSDNNQREVGHLVWFFDSAYEKVHPLTEPGGDTGENIQALKDVLKEAYDRVYHIMPRILTLRYFSFVKEIFGGTPRWNIVLVTDNLGLDLETFLKNYREKKENIFFKRQALDILIQMTECLTFLHESHYLHGDLKIDNFFVVHSDPNVLEGIEIFLGDLGQSRLGDVTKANYGFPPFKAPEFSQGRTKKTDIYALGLTFLQVISPNVMDVWINRFSKISARVPDVGGGERPPIFNMNQDLHDLIKECLAENVDVRPSAHEILRRLREIRSGIDPMAIVSRIGGPVDVLPGEYCPPSDLSQAMEALQVSGEAESNYTNSLPPPPPRT